MRKWISLLSLLILVSSCEEKETNALDGIWVTVYTQLGNSKKFPSYSRNLLEFKDTTVLVTAIGDLSSNNFSKTDQRSMDYEMIDSSFNLSGDQYIIRFGGDSMYLKPVGSEGTLIVFKRLSEELKNPIGSDKDFKGKFSWIGSDQSFDFIGDSIVIPKVRMDGIELPAEKWNIMEYKGYKFLNIHNEMFGLSIIKSSDDKNIHLLKNNIKLQEVHLKKENIILEYEAEQFFGKWRSNNFREGEAELNIEIEKNNLTLKKDSITETYGWHLNSEGNQIFFPSIANQKNGVCKVLELTDNQITMEMFGWGSLANNISIVVLERIEKD